MIIDAHAHVAAFDGAVATASRPKINMSVLLREMANSSVTRALVIADFRRGKASTPDTVTLLQFAADKEPISVAGSIDALNYELRDLDELDFWLEKRKIVAVKLYPGYQHFYPNDRNCGPIYELCRRYDVPVIFHSGDTLITSGLKTKVKYSHPLAVDDVAADYPDLKIVIAHVGNPWMTDCAEVLYRHVNVFADLSGLFLESATEPTERYLDLMRRKINDLIAYSSASKLMFGTDWPLARHKTYIDFVRSLDIESPADWDDVFWRNAARLFHLPEGNGAL